MPATGACTSAKEREPRGNAAGQAPAARTRVEGQHPGRSRASVTCDQEFVSTQEEPLQGLAETKRSCSAFSGRPKWPSPRYPCSSLIAHRSSLIAHRSSLIAHRSCPGCVLSRASGLERVTGRPADKLLATTSTTVATASRRDALRSDGALSLISISLAQVSRFAAFRGRSVGGYSVSRPPCKAALSDATVLVAYGTIRIGEAVRDIPWVRRLRTRPVVDPGITREEVQAVCRCPCRTQALLA